MIICICRNLNDKAVRDAVEAGAATPYEVHAYHGGRLNCGKCTGQVNKVIADCATSIHGSAQLAAAS